MLEDSGVFGPQYRCLVAPMSSRSIELARRGLGWVGGRPVAVDVVTAVVVALLSFAELAGRAGRAERAVDLLAVSLVLGGSCLLLVRRQAPLRVLVVIFAALAVLYLRDYGTLAPPLGLAAVYAAAAHGGNRRATWVTIAVSVAVLFGVACVGILNAPDGFRYGDGLGLLVTCAVAAIIGAVGRNRHEIFVSTQVRADHAEATRLAEADRAVVRERLRIAREMHDVVAHSMSAISVQAAGARGLVHSDPDRAAKVMDNVETAAREALHEMRRMLGVLRGDEPATGLAPQPGLADVETMIARSNEAGVSTTYTVTGVARELPPGIELAAYRIVQEALTNVRKHAGSATSATVSIDFAPHRLTVDVVDDGAGSASVLSHAGAGNGLIGMRERVEIYDGELLAGPRTGGGYAVSARFPLGEVDVLASLRPAQPTRPVTSAPREETA